MSRLVMAGLLALAGCGPTVPDDAAVPAEARESATDRLPPASAPPLVPAQGPRIPDPPPVRSAEIPPEFRGEWNMDPAACGTGLNDSRLVLEPRRLRFHESVGEVIRVATAAPDTLEATARFHGEGETWEATHRFRLVDDALVTPGEGGASAVRRRCLAEPKGAAAHSAPKG